MPDNPQNDEVFIQKDTDSFGENAVTEKPNWFNRIVNSGLGAFGAGGVQALSSDFRTNPSVIGALLGAASGAYNNEDPWKVPSNAGNLVGGALPFSKTTNNLNPYVKALLPAAATGGAEMARSGVGAGLERGAAEGAGAAISTALGQFLNRSFLGKHGQYSAFKENKLAQDLMETAGNKANTYDSGRDLILAQKQRKRAATSAARLEEALSKAQQELFELEQKPNKLNKDASGRFIKSPEKAEAKTRVSDLEKSYNTSQLKLEKARSNPLLQTTAGKVDSALHDIRKTSDKNSPARSQPAREFIRRNLESAAKEGPAGQASSGSAATENLVRFRQRFPNSTEPQEEFFKHLAMRIGVQAPANKRGTNLSVDPKKAEKAITELYNLRPDAKIAIFGSEKAANESLNKLLRLPTALARAEAIAHIDAGGTIGATGGRLGLASLANLLNPDVLSNVITKHHFKDGKASPALDSFLELSSKDPNVQKYLSSPGVAQRIISTFYDTVTQDESEKKQATPLAITKE